MKKAIYILIIMIVLMFADARESYAENIAVGSAALKVDSYGSGFDYRVENLKMFFEKYNSPLAAYAEKFVKYADEYNLDYRLIPAITGVESTFGKRIPKDSYNAYGWANGGYKFISWEALSSTYQKCLKVHI